MLIHSPAFTAFFLHQTSTEKKRKEKKKKLHLHPSHSLRSDRNTSNKYRSRLVLISDEEKKNKEDCTQSGCGHQAV